MFGRKKEEAPKKRRPNAGAGLSQFGLMDVDVGIGNMDPTGEVDDDDDDALEAELLALTSDTGPPRAPPKRAAPKKVAPVVNLDSMIAASMRDIPSDEELSGDDDPDLLNELSALNEEEEEPLPPVIVEPPKKEERGGGGLISLLNERLKMYQEAETNAKTSGDSSRARRLGRGIKTLTGQLKQAKAGRVVNEEEIPPPVAISVSSRAEPASGGAELASGGAEPAREGAELASGGAEPASEGAEPAVPSRPAPPPPVVDAHVLAALAGRRDEYKRAAVAAKKAGDTDTALRYVKVAKQFDPVIAAVESGQAVDLSEMPPPPPSDAEPSPVVTTPPTVELEEASAEAYPAPPPAPASVKEALEQRLAKYRSVQAAAEEEGNASKARRTGRIVKQYEDALKLHRAGKPVPVEDLPTPPGFGPIPQEGALPTPAAPPVRAPSPGAPPSVPLQKSAAPPATPPRPPREEAAVAPKPNVRKSPQSRQEKQLALLLARQKEFKEAALEAKRKGEVSQAKEYLRLAKGFDPLIEASNCGLPVDMNTVPVPPGTPVPVESDFDMVDVEDCLPGTDAEVFEKLEADLLKQAKMCLTTRDHFKAIGDVASANRFEKLAIHSKKDLDTLRYAQKRSEPVPKFHYETKTFSIVQCCTDLGDNDLELTIVQGINYTVPNPKDVDTYVKFEFPYPSEDPPKDRTPLVKDTNNPEYNATFPLAIHRNSRVCQRVFKRHSIKLEVWSRGSLLQSLRNLCCAVKNNKAVSSGFLRSDTIIGTVLVKLLPLETKCTLHDSFDLMDGRRPIGGKLEVKIRLRNPMLTKQVEQVNEKWLIIDQLL